MAGSGLLKFWSLLSEAKFTGSSPKITEDAVRQMAKTVGVLEYEIEAVIRGLPESQKETE
jgi:hypothetical protein